MTTENNEEVRRAAGAILSWRGRTEENTPPAVFSADDYAVLSGELEGCFAVTEESTADPIGQVAKRAADELRAVRISRENLTGHCYVGIRTGGDTLMTELNIAFDEVLSGTGELGVTFGVTYEDAPGNEIVIVVCPS